MNKRIKFPETRWFDIKNVTAASADIYIYDEISPYAPGCNAQDVVTQLKNLKDVPQLNVRINSPGGSVFDGMAIHNALTRHPGTVHVHIDGLAASIASVIAMAGKEIHMAENAMLMIHDPAAFTFGDAAELRKQADVLDQIKETIINVYAARTGEDRTVIAKCMSDESWFTAEEAVKAKLVTHTTTPMKMAACFNLQDFGYRKAPENQTALSKTPRSLLQRKQALLEKE